MIPVCEPCMAGKELEYVSDCIKTNWISSNGRYITQFEDSFSRYCGTKYGIGCSNGTVALHLALAAIGIGPGDEVIIPDFTMIATANAVAYCGATPIPVDSEPRTWNMDVRQIKEKITSKTKAIMPVHIYGHPVDMDPLLKLAKEHNLLVIEDAAEAHGALYKNRKTGSLGDAACFSFYANKLITTGEGGMVVTNNEQIAEKARLLRNHAFGKPRFVHNEIGFNYRMTNIQAAIGCAQMEKIDEFVDAR
ncbi:MAG: DegT/DnrJ/EryC1/StrS family aminotransferase, partial [Nanoarchaeota archaeon]|nr:DegT/DnrJ/EryC1/StrS family aminotransferase [Nanoarchaeota archaeon]